MFPKLRITKPSINRQIYKDFGLKKVYHKVKYDHCFLSDQCIYYTPTFASFQFHFFLLWLTVVPFCSKKEKIEILCGSLHTLYRLFSKDSYVVCIRKRRLYLFLSMFLIPIKLRRFLDMQKCFYFIAIETLIRN